MIRMDADGKLAFRWGDQQFGVEISDTSPPESVVRCLLDLAELIRCHHITGPRKVLQEYEVMEKSGIHPAPQEFTGRQLEADPILRYFYYAHLPQPLQNVSSPFCRLAGFIVGNLPRNAERSVALRKLLEAKDAGVRANVGETFHERQSENKRTDTNTHIDHDEDVVVRVTGGGSSEEPIPFDE